MRPTIILWLTALTRYNDILSIKKEVVGRLGPTRFSIGRYWLIQAQNQVDSLIPLLYIANDHNLQAAIDDATRILVDAVAHFEHAADALLEDSAGEMLVRADIVKFIDSCRYACTANLNWRWVVTGARGLDLRTNLGICHRLIGSHFSLRSGRYQLNVKSLHGGITLSIWIRIIASGRQLP